MGASSVFSPSSTSTPQYRRSRVVISSPVLLTTTSSTPRHHSPIVDNCDSRNHNTNDDDDDDVNDGGGNRRPPPRPKRDKKRRPAPPPPPPPPAPSLQVQQKRFIDDDVDDDDEGVGSCERPESQMSMASTLTLTTERVALESTDSGVVDEEPCASTIPPPSSSLTSCAVNRRLEENMKDPRLSEMADEHRYALLTATLLRQQQRSVSSLCLENGDRVDSGVGHDADDDADDDDDDDDDRHHHRSRRHHHHDHHDDHDDGGNSVKDFSSIPCERMTTTSTTTTTMTTSGAGHVTLTLPLPKTSHNRRKSTAATSTGCRLSHANSGGDPRFGAVVSRRYSASVVASPLHRSTDFRDSGLLPANSGFQLNMPLSSNVKKILVSNEVLDEVQSSLTNLNGHTIMRKRREQARDSSSSSSTTTIVVLGGGGGGVDHDCCEKGFDDRENVETSPNPSDDVEEPEVKPSPPKEVTFEVGTMTKTSPNPAAAADFPPLARFSPAKMAAMLHTVGRRVATSAASLYWTSLDLLDSCSPAMLRRHRRRQNEADGGSAGDNHDNDEGRSKRRSASMHNLPATSTDKSRVEIVLVTRPDSTDSDDHASSLGSVSIPRNCGSSVVSDTPSPTPSLSIDREPTIIIGHHHHHLRHHHQGDVDSMMMPGIHGNPAQQTTITNGLLRKNIVDIVAPDDSTDSTSGCESGIIASSRDDDDDDDENDDDDDACSFASVSSGLTAVQA